MRRDLRVIAADEVITRNVGEELVLLDLARGVYYGLNPIGARIWALLCEGLSIAETVERLAEEHDVTREELESDVVRLIEELQERNLVTATEA